MVKIQMVSKELRLGNTSLDSGGCRSLQRGKEAEDIHTLRPGGEDTPGFH